MSDILLFSLNGGGWALKPILEKISVDKIGHYYFTFIRYFISGIIAIPFLIQHYYYNGFPKAYKKNGKLFFKDVVIWGSIVSVVAMAAIMANYYLLEKFIEKCKGLDVEIVVVTEVSLRTMLRDASLDAPSVERIHCILFPSKMNPSPLWFHH